MTMAGIGGRGAIAGTEPAEVRAVRAGKAEARRRHAPAVAAAVSMLVLWQLVVTGFGVPTYIAPSPVQVLQVFVEQGDVLWINFWPTLLEAMAGFALGNTIAVLLAVWFVHNRLAERAFYPTADVAVVGGGPAGTAAAVSAARRRGWASTTTKCWDEVLVAGGRSCGMSVDFDVSGGVARITLNRPERLNAVDSASEAALAGIWDAIDRDPEIRCAVLTGAGRAFCAGADMKEEGPGGLAYWAGTGDGGFGGIALGRRPSVPVIARVNGLALGGGFEMVLGCDLVVAAETASFGLPEPRVGRLPLDGMVTLPRRLPRALAMGILLTGRRIGAAQALEYGLVNEVVPDERLDAAVDAWVEDLVACAPLSLKAIKRSAADTAHLTAIEARNACLPSLAAALQSRDADEGVQAFREKRAPIWTGR